MRMAATHGLAVSPLSDDRTTAPRKAPTAPGKVISRTVRQSTLPKRQWETPDTAVVPSSARWTEMESMAWGSTIVRPQYPGYGGRKGCRGGRADGVGPAAGRPERGRGG